MARSFRSFLPLLGLMLLAITSASAFARAVSQNPASGFFTVIEQRVGETSRATPDRIKQKTAFTYELASDFAVAARGAANALPKLQRIHSAETLTKGSAKYGYDSVRKMSTDDIVKSLRPGAKEPLLVKPDGRIFDGNTRILVLEERGFDINSLPRTLYGN